MYIKHIKIKNFRSVEELSIDCDRMAVLCGSNSVGKSNIFRALEFAFKLQVDEHDVWNNLSHNKRNSNVQIQIDLVFKNVPKKVRDIVSAETGSELKFVFRATKKGNVTRKLNNTKIDDNQFNILLSEFSIVYIPTIRDLDGEGIRPFQMLFRKSIYQGKSGKQIKEHISGIKSELAKKANGILTDQKDIVQKIFNAKSFDINTDSVVIDDSYDSIQLAIKTKQNTKVSLNDVGTGHQSVAIISLYRQLGEATPGHTLYLFEEPDTHLHPPTIRAVGEELLKASSKSQVLITTHSPILISHIGLDKVYHLTHSEQSGTTIKRSDFKKDDQASVSHLLMQFGLRVTEALFTKTVILVEGPTDVALFGRLIERRQKRNVDQLDLIIVPAGGKSTMSRLANALSKLGVDWLAILDFDAAYNTDSIPITDEEEFENIDDEFDYSDAIESLEELVDTTNNRGRNVIKHLKLLKTELENGRPHYELYNGSALKQLLIDGRNASQRSQDQIVKAIRQNKKTIYRKLLKEMGVFLVRPDIENILVAKQVNLPEIERVLRKYKLIKTGTPTPCSKSLLTKRLHSIGHKSEILIEIVDSLDEISGFARTELNIYVDQIIEHING